MQPHQQKELISLIEKSSKEDGIHDTVIPRLKCVKMSSPTTPMPVVYEPAFCLLVQGKKQSLLEGEVFKYGAGDYLVVSVDLPIAAHVLEASPEKPYMGFALSIDPHQLSELITQTGKNFNATETTRRGLLVSKADANLTDALLRLVRLIDTPQDIPFLAPAMVREIYYRLLTGEQGDLIAQIAVAGSNMQKIGKVITMIKEKFSEAIRVEEMAELTNMSPSSFHFHFKEVTAMSPLQYQKRLRLMEARRLLLSEISDASTASYRVGYESPSQFSREYSRMFGLPPISDIEKLKASAMTQAV